MSIALNELIQALHRLPGVGVKSASRMAFHLLQQDKESAQKLAQALQKAVAIVVNCPCCNTLTDATPNKNVNVNVNVNVNHDESIDMGHINLCSICQNPNRDASRLCIVETPADQMVIEQTQTFNGVYFVLMGKLNPLDGVGVNQVGVRPLLVRIAETQKMLKEIILATNFTAEGQLTAHVILQITKEKYPHILTTRLAKGVPMGSELEYVDANTIAHAFLDRH